jgi:hypothetical protein
MVVRVCVYIRGWPGFIRPLLCYLQDLLCPLFMVSDYVDSVSICLMLLMVWFSLFRCMIVLNMFCLVLEWQHSAWQW